LADTHPGNNNNNNNNNMSSPVIWEECVATPHGREWTRPFHVLLAVQQHTHTHTIILLLFWNLSGTTRMSRYQKGKTRKGKTNLDLLEQEIVSGSGICWAICNAYSLRPPARSLSLWATYGFTSSPIVHTRRVPPCIVQSRLGAFPR